MTIPFAERRRSEARSQNARTLLIRRASSELEHVNAVERHRASIGHAIDGPHHRCLMIDHEDLARDDLDRLVPAISRSQNSPISRCPRRTGIADGILLGSVGRERSEPCLSVASSQEAAYARIIALAPSARSLQRSFVRPTLSSLDSRTATTASWPRTGTRTHTHPAPPYAERPGAERSAQPRPLQRLVMPQHAFASCSEGAETEFPRSRGRGRRGGCPGHPRTREWFPAACARDVPIRSLAPFRRKR
jgi:hypothetical protein